MSQNMKESNKIIHETKEESTEIMLESKVESRNIKSTCFERTKKVLSDIEKDSYKIVADNGKASTEVVSQAKEESTYSTKAKGKIEAVSFNETVFHDRKDAYKNNTTNIIEKIELTGSSGNNIAEIRTQSTNGPSEIKPTSVRKEIEILCDTKKDLTESVCQNVINSMNIMPQTEKELTQIKKEAKKNIYYSEKESKKLKLEGLIQTIRNMSQSKEELTERMSQDKGESNENKFSGIKETKIVFQPKIQSVKASNKCEHESREIISYTEKESKKELEGLLQTKKNMSQSKEELTENISQNENESSKHEFSKETKEIMSQHEMKSTNTLSSENKLSIHDDLKSILKNQTFIDKSEIKKETDAENNVKFSSPVVTQCIDITPRAPEPSPRNLRSHSRRLSYSLCSESSDLYNETLKDKEEISVIEFNTTEAIESFDTSFCKASDFSGTADDKSAGAVCSKTVSNKESLNETDLAHEENRSQNNASASFGKEAANVSQIRNPKSVTEFDDSFDADARAIILAPFLENDSEYNKSLQYINEAETDISQKIPTNTQKCDTVIIKSHENSIASTLEDDLNYIRDFLQDNIFEISEETETKVQEKCASSPVMHDLNSSDAYNFDMITACNNEAANYTSTEFNNLCNTNFSHEKEWLGSQKLSHDTESLDNVELSSVKTDSETVGDKSSETSNLSTFDDSENSTVETSNMYSEHIASDMSPEKNILSECELDKNKNYTSSLSSSETFENFNIAKIPILISCGVVKSPPNNISSYLEDISYEEAASDRDRVASIFEDTNKADNLSNTFQQNENNTDYKPPDKKETQDIQVIDDSKSLELLDSVIPVETKNITLHTETQLVYEKIEDHKMNMELVSSFKPFSENIIKKSETSLVDENIEDNKTSTELVSSHKLLPENIIQTSENKLVCEKIQSDNKSIEANLLKPLSENIIQMSERNWGCYKVEDDKIILDLTNSFKPARSKEVQKSETKLEYKNNNNSEMLLEPINTVINTGDTEAIEKLSSLSKTGKSGRGKKSQKNQSQLIDGESIQQPVKRRRGRKRKAEIGENNSNSEILLPPKRRRGRPPKVKTEVNQPLKSELINDVTMNKVVNENTIKELKAVDFNGNAKIPNSTCDFQCSDSVPVCSLSKDIETKNVTETVQQVPKRGRGRPRKVKTIESENIDQGSPNKLQPKKRGRKKKIVINVDEEFNMKSKKLIQDIDTFGFENIPLIEHLNIKIEITNEETSDNNSGNRTSECSQSEEKMTECTQNEEDTSEYIKNEEIVSECIQNKEKASENIQNEENNVQQSDIQQQPLTEKKPVSKRGRKKALQVKEIHLKAREGLLKMLKRDKEEPRPWDDNIDLKNPTYLFCNTCDKYMDSRELFESHICKYGVGSGVLATICHNCSQAVVLPSIQKPGRGRKKLMADAPVHECTARIFKCPFCEAAFITKHQYRLHKLFHFAPEWMEYVVRPRDRDRELAKIKQTEDFKTINITELTTPRDLTAPC